MASLRTWHTWRHMPWSVYAIYISQMINFAAVWDPLLVWTLTRTNFYTESTHKSLLVLFLTGWILLSKMVKIAPHFYDHPSDLVWLPAYIAFAYWHSFVKLYCAFTFWNHGWNGRNLKVAQVASVRNLERDELDSIVPARPKTLRGITGLYPAEANLRHPSSVVTTQAARGQLKKEKIPI